MIEARTKPDAAIVVTGQHVLFHKVVNDRINRRKRCLHRLGNGVGTGRRTRFVQMVNDLYGSVDAADARARALLPSSEDESSRASPDEDVISNSRSRTSKNLLRYYGIARRGATEIMRRQAGKLER